MKRKLSIYAISLWFIATLCIPLKAQVLKDTSSLKLMCKGVDYIYNLQFAQANEVYQEIKSAYPEHPMTYIFKSLMTYWEYYPLTVTSSVRESYENDLKHAIELCEKKSHPNDAAEYLLCNVGARGMLLLFYADNDLSMEVISMASSTYQLVRQTFDFTGSYSDFYFFTGLYNYYREAYPETHPVYKPFALLFPKGNKAKGIRELQIASKNAIILKAEAHSFLTGISINFENDFQQGCLYSKALHDLYPKNIEYLAEYIKNLLLIKRYDEAESLINSSQQKISNVYFQAILSVLNGILYEKKYHNLKQAEIYYTKGIRDIAPFGKFGNDYTAFAYFGLSRIVGANNDKRYKKSYRKQALELASYKKVNFDD